MEGIEELPHEDIKDRVLHFLTHFVPLFHPSWLSTAYRLGKPADSPYPRKAGHPGHRIFVNEDISEESKRKRADIRKYGVFLREKGINATQKGEGIIINDTYHTIDDLSHMLDGLTLKDSRTFIGGKYWAFQSKHSPLSNLYLCSIKRNGIQYASSKHAYQHA